MQGYGDKVKDFNEKTKVVIDKVMGTLKTGSTTERNADGLTDQMDCLPVGAQLDNLYDVLCVGFLPELAQTAAILAICSFFMFFGAFCVFCTGYKYANTNFDGKESAK